MVIAWVMFGLIAWIIVAIWPARVAYNKGYSFLLWFAISMFFWWITLFIVYFGLKDKTKTPEDVASDKAVTEFMDEEMRRGSGSNQ